MSKQTLYEKLKEYGSGDIYPYHMPGHKRKRLTGAIKNIADIDITEIYDFDNLSDPNGILKNAQDSLAEYLGVQKSYYLVNGSTVGVLAAISAAVPKGGKLLISRNAHKSTYNACLIRNIEPSYIYPYIIEGLNICEAVTAKQISHALESDKLSSKEKDNKTIDAVIIVSPTYEGRIADIKAIADVVHSYGIPLIVDEAHGAHLCFSDGIEGYSVSACKQGADIVIQSLHKTIPSPTQTAVMHVNSKLIDAEIVEKYLHVYQTSSPSYVLMAAMEASINYMKEFGRDRLAFLQDRFSDLVDVINNTCIYIEALPFIAGVHDPGKFVFSARKAGLTGKELTDILRDDYHLEFEMSVREYVLAMFTVADDEEAYSRLKEALIDIDKRISKSDSDIVLSNRGKIFDTEPETPSKNETGAQNICNGYEYYCMNEAVYPMSTAWEMKGEYILLQDAAGYCANDFIGLYPPGTPILVPGERITDRHIVDLQNYIECGYEVTGISDEKIKVII